MTLPDVLANIYRQLGVPQPRGMAFQYILADIYRQLGVPPPSGVSMHYILEDIARHLEAAKGPSYGLTP